MTIGVPESFDRPEGFDVRAAFPADAKLLGGDLDDHPTARVLVSGARASSVVAGLGDDAVVERRSDGSVVVAVPCTNRSAFLSWVLGLVEHAVVLDPPEERAAVVDWLTAVAAGGASDGR